MYLERQSAEAKRSKQFTKAASFSSVLPFGKSLWQLESVIQDLVVAESMTQGVVVAEHDDDSNGELVEVKQIDT